MFRSKYAPARSLVSPGSMSFAGRDITRLDARQRKELGIAHVPEDRHRRGLLLDFSLAENTILGVHYRKPAVTGLGSVFLDQKEIQRRAEIGAIEFIHRKIVAMREAGCAVLLVSAELEEVTALSDRLLVIHNGQIVGEVDPKTTTSEEIGLMMTGWRHN